MSGAAAKTASEAADALLEWLGSQAARSTTSAPVALPRVGLSGEGGEGTQSAPMSNPTVDQTSYQSVDKPARPLAWVSDALRPAMRLPSTDWLHHRLTISGSAADVGRFRQAAAGAGIIPWQLDLERMEEDYFHLLVAPEQRSLSIAGARIFGRQLRDAVQRRHDLAVTRVGHSQACPFDLHALVPVPIGILALGPDEPRALAWLWAHWGTTEALRHVAEETSRTADAEVKGAVEASFRMTFWSADWTPWPALTYMASAWPGLRFDIRPTYDPP